MTQVSTDWARAELGVTELMLVRDRPWSRVWRAEAPSGRWWLKENRAGTTYEPALLGLLARSAGDLLPAVRVHPRQPWALLADAGLGVGELSAGAVPERRAAFWAALLARYGEVQRRVAADDLRAAGVPDLSTARLAETYEGLLAEPGWFAPALVADLGPGELAAARGCGPALARAVAELAGGRPPALQHDDLHAGNVFAASLDDPVGAKVVDWGDACLSHPFGTLRVALDALADDLDRAGHRDPALLDRVRDAYLEGWRTAGESTTALREELDRVLRVAPLVRAAAWARALGGPGGDPGWASGVVVWLVRLAEGLDARP